MYLYQLGLRVSRLGKGFHLRIDRGLILVVFVRCFVCAICSGCCGCAFLLISVHVLLGLQVLQVQMLVRSCLDA